MTGQAHGYDDIIKYLAIQDNKRILISEKYVPVFTVTHGERMLNWPTKSLSENSNPNHFVHFVITKCMVV